MSSCGPPGRSPIVIDLISDDDDVPASSKTDLTSVGHPPISSHVSHEPEVKVEDESSTLVDSSTGNSGDSSPNTQQDNGIAQSESNPTDVGNLSPRHPQDPGFSSSDDNLTLGAILARSKKRKHDSGDIRTSEPRSNDMPTALPPTALNPLVGSQSLKPNFDNFFFVRKQIVKEPHSEKSKEAEKSTTPRDESGSIQKGTHSAKSTNPHILNIVREEVFGEEKKKKRKKHRSDPSPQNESGKQLAQVNGQAFSTPAPPRAVSEAPEAVRPKKKIEHYGAMRPSKARGEADSERPSKRRKHDSHEDTASGSTSFTAASNTTESQAVSVGNAPGHRSKKISVERSHPAGKEKATEKPRGFSKFRPGDHRSSRVEKTTSHARRRKEHDSQARAKAHKSKYVGSGSQRGEKAYMVADQNEQGHWAPSRFQRTGMVTPLPSESRSTRRVTSGWSGGLGETRKGRCALGSGATRSQMPLESNSESISGQYGNHHEASEEHASLKSAATGSEVPLESSPGYTARMGQNVNLQEDQEVTDFGFQQSQQVRDSGYQREIPGVQSQSNTAQPARRINQLQQTVGLGDKDLEATRAFFKKHPSQLAQQRKTMFVDSIPPGVGKPSYLDRHRVVKRSTGKKFSSKRQTAWQTARKRDRDREKQIRQRRELLEAKVEELFPHESKEFKDRRIEAGLDELRKKHARNDERREAEKAQGLLTVKYIEDIEGAEDDPIEGPLVAAPKGKRRGIPVAKALEPGATITLYVVYKSEPFEKGKEFGEYELRRMEDQFFIQKDANKHAEAVLRDDRHDGSQLVSIQFRVDPEDGLFFGTKELADGKLVVCMVQKERQMSSDLELRDVFVHKELKQIYCPRYDVFHTYVIPKVFLQEEETSIDGDKEKESESKSKTSTPNPGEDEPNPGENEHEDDDNDSLFSGPPIPDPESDDQSDADSIATSATLQPSEPGGNMGSLSYKHVEYMHELVGSFTTLELANKEAFKVALERWRPRGARMDAWLHYRYAVKPSLEEMWAEDLDVRLAEFDFDVPEFEGHVKDRPWRFIHARVYVTQTRLEGPRDIGNYVVTGNGEDNGEQGEGEDSEEDGEHD